MSAAPKRIRAAQYIRMSTDKQIYSVGHQTTAIAAYALERNWEIVKSYIDEGRSGLSIARRDALQCLLADALVDDPAFNVILVFDVSRWGRFQDTDESAHYEFLCRKAGVPVHYCAEFFENDGSFASAIMKSLKRVMAGEYSRDLSARVGAALRRLAKAGHKMGGRPPYGYRRMLLDAAGTSRFMLQAGQVKALKSDRVVLVPGPAEEVATIKRIYRLCTVRGYSDQQIADALNHDQIPPGRGLTWTRCSVRYVLTSERYIGIQIYNRSTQVLHSPRRKNPRDEWIRTENAHPPLIDCKTFRAAQKLRARHRSTMASDEMLNYLEELLHRKKTLSWDIIDRSTLTPSAQTYWHRFGSLEAAYDRIGYIPEQLDYCSVGVGLKPKVLRFIEEVRHALVKAGGRIDIAPRGRVMVIDGRAILGVTLAQRIDGSREAYWRIRRNPEADLDYVLLGAMAASNRRIGALYLLPIDRFSDRTHRVTIVEGGSRMEQYRLVGLDRLYNLIRAYEV